MSGDTLVDQPYCYVCVCLFAVTCCSQYMIRGGHSQQDDSGLHTADCDPPVQMKTSILQDTLPKRGVSENGKMVLLQVEISKTHVYIAKGRNIRSPKIAKG